MIAEVGFQSLAHLEFWRKKVLDTNGKLTAEEKRRATDRINHLWKEENRACPICGDRTWILGDHLVQPLTLGPDGDVLLGGVGYPQVMVISPNCGYTMFLNAVILGIAESSENIEKPISSPVAA
jgi:hypothetical protein